MEAIYYSILVAILPFLFLLGFSFLPRKTRSLPKLSMTWPVILLVVLVFLIGLYPVELSTDKIRYVIKYQEAVSNNGDYEFREQRWQEDGESLLQDLLPERSEEDAEGLRYLPTFR